MKGQVYCPDVYQVSPMLSPDSLLAGGKGLNLKKKNKLKPFLSPVIAPTLARAKAGTGTTIPESDISTEIRVCLNRTCRRQGSMDILQTLSGIAPAGVSVKSCGCLGKCGAGPNLVILPGATFVKHCATAARAARTLFDHVHGSGAGIDSESWIKNSLVALALRKKAEDNCTQAEQLLSEAINLKPCGGIHFLYKDRSAARLMMGNVAEALEDGQEAITHAPKYAEAYICRADALVAMDQYDAAEKSYAMAIELDPSIVRSKAFKARITKLQEKLVAADAH